MFSRACFISSSSSPSILLSPKLSHFHSSHSLNFPICHKTRRIRNPRTSICHGKLNSETSGRRGPLEEIEEAFYNIDEADSEDEEDEEEEEEAESSLDLLAKLVQSMFNKASKRAKKATRSVLPPLISPQLVSFAVDGVLLLSSLSIAKAFLEVVCTLGGSVFIVILLLRVIWATISHFQASGTSFNQGGSSYGTTQPV